MKIVGRYGDDFFTVQASADELARCLAFDNNERRVGSPGQAPFRVGDIVLVEPHPQPKVRSEGVAINENPGTQGREFQAT